MSSCSTKNLLYNSAPQSSKNLISQLVEEPEISKQVSIEVLAVPVEGEPVGEQSSCCTINIMSAAGVKAPQSSPAGGKT